MTMRRASLRAAVPDAPVCGRESGFRCDNDKGPRAGIGGAGALYCARREPGAGSA